jgi:hypothetical protein
MGLILSEPTKQIVEIPKISVENAKIHPNRPYNNRGRKPKTEETKTIFFCDQPKRKL